MTIAILFAVAAFAAELQKINVENSKDQPYTVHVGSGNETIAELKVIQPGTLNVEGGDVVWRMVPGGGKAINCSGGSKVDLIVEGKSVLTLSGGSMTLQSGITTQGQK